MVAVQFIWITICYVRSIIQYTHILSKPGAQIWPGWQRRDGAILVGAVPKEKLTFSCVHVVKYEFAYKFYLVGGGESAAFGSKELRRRHFPAK